MFRKILKPGQSDMEAGMCSMRPKKPVGVMLEIFRALVS